MENSNSIGANVLAKLNTQHHTLEWLSQETGIPQTELNQELANVNALTFFHAILIASALGTKAPALADETITAHQLAATELGCSVDKVYRMARNGDIPALRVGRSWRFVLHEVREALTNKPTDSWALPSKMRKARS